MKHLFLGSMLAIAAIGLTAEIEAAERGTPGEAKAMLSRAITHYKAVCRDKALADFTAKKAPFVDRDIYVVCLGPDHKVIAHGAFPQLVGSSSDALKDADGKPLGQALWDAAQGKSDGEVRYRWLNPLTGKTEPKVSFAQRVDSDVCVVGAYNP